MRMQVLSLASLSGLRIQHYLELWRRSQMRLGSGVAVAVVLAGSCSSDSTASLGTSICQGEGLKKKNPKTKPPPQKKTVDFSMGKKNFWCME